MIDDYSLYLMSKQHIAWLHAQAGMRRLAAAAQQAREAARPPGVRARRWRLPVDRLRAYVARPRPAAGALALTRAARGGGG